MNKRVMTKLFFLLLITVGTCRACGCAENLTDFQPKRADVNSVEAVLEQLNQKTLELKSYEARIEYLVSQPLFESKTLRKGILYYQKCGEKSALRLNFQTLKHDDEKEQKYIEQYVFDGVWLTQIDYQIKEVKRYQQAEPNEPVDVFDLAGENFPVIGFTKIEDLKKQFEIRLVEQKIKEPDSVIPTKRQSVIPAKAGIQDFIQLHLKVKPDSVYKDDYISIDFWIDKKLYLPAKIIAVSTEQDICQIKFLEPKVNKKIDKKAFEIKIPKGFTTETTPLKKEHSVALEPGTSDMISIANLRVSQEDLAFDYRIRNGFSHDIWVCEDIDVYGKFDVTTRIEEEILFIKLSFNLPCNVLLGEAVVAKYRRLQPGAIHKGKVSLELPIGNASPVYDFDELEKGNTVELHHAVFEVGYFTEDLLKMISDDIKKGKEDPNNEEAYCMALVLEGVKQNNSSDLVYIPHLWEGITNEKILEVDITNVSIPCYVTDKKQ